MARSPTVGAVMQLVILAGGLGTRLRSVIPAGTPKPMALVAGRPFLELLLDQAVERGVERVVLLTSYAADEISDHFGDTYRSLRISYSVEPSPLGTGGAIRHAGDLLEDTFLLANGDTFATVDYRALLARSADAPLAMCLAQVEDSGRFGGVRVQASAVVELLEKGTAGSGLINAGVYACRRDLLDHFPDRPSFSFEKDVMEPLIPVLRPPYELTESVFFDIGVPSDLRAADEYFSRRRPLS